jgi:hypothetical protein
MSYYVCKKCIKTKSNQEILRQKLTINIVKNKCIFCNKKKSFHSKLNKKMSKIYKKCKNFIYNNGIFIIKLGYIIIMGALFILIVSGLINIWFLPCLICILIISTKYYCCM